MTTPRPKYHPTLAAAMKAADDKRRQGLAWLFGIQPEPNEPPPNEGAEGAVGDWGTGASGGNPPDAGSLDERVDQWLKDYTRRNRR